MIFPLIPFVVISTIAGAGIGHMKNENGFWKYLAINITMLIMLACISGILVVGNFCGMGSYISSACSTFGDLSQRIYVVNCIFFIISCYLIGKTKNICLYIFLVEGVIAGVIFLSMLG